MSFTVLTIQPNDWSVGKSITPYVEIKEIQSPEEMMEYVVTTLNMTPTVIGDTSIFHETGTHIYQLCHVSPKTNETPVDNSTDNAIASHLVIGSDRVYGPAIAIASRINPTTHTCETDSMTLEQLNTFVIEKLSHRGVRLTTKNEVKEFEFKDDILAEQGLNPDQWKWMEVTFLKFSFVLVVQIDPLPTEVNRIATRLLGTSRVCGDVLLVHKLTENVFGNVSADLMRKILPLTYGPLSTRELTEDEKKDAEKIDGLPFVFNRYCSLDKRLQELKVKCGGCGGVVNDQVKTVCTGCYRIKYHDKECQVRGWNDHKKACLHDQKSINEVIVEKDAAQASKVETEGEVTEEVVVEETISQE